MKTKDKLLEMQLEIAQIDVALNSKSDFAQSMQQELVLRELLLRDAIEQLIDSENHEGQRTLH